MSALKKLTRLLQDPPPEIAFEISPHGIAMSRTEPPASVQHIPLTPGVISPSPVRENVQDPAALAQAVTKLALAGRSRGHRRAALILPDNSIRLSVLDFDNMPEKEEERRSLIKFRLRKSVPFDVDSAALSYSLQTGHKMVVAITPADVIAHYEAPFRAAGFHPGMVTVSSLAMLQLIPPAGLYLVAKCSPGFLTVLALRDGLLLLARSLELSVDEIDPLEEISSDLYPTLAYIEDQTGARPEKLFIAGFGSEIDRSGTRLSIELDIPIEPIYEPHPGLAGYLASLSPQDRQPGRKAAAA